MKTPLLRVLALTALLATPALAQDTAVPTALALGSPVPHADVAMKGVDGKSISIAQAAGKKGTLVVFTCNACPWVKNWEARIAEIGNAAVKSGIGVIAINANDPAQNAEDGYDEMVKRARKLGMRFSYVVDASSDVARAFGATRTPEAFLFDAKGQLVYHGTIDDNAREPKAVKERWLHDAVTAVSAGKPIAAAQTKALGCTIKFRKSAS